MSERKGETVERRPGAARYEWDDFRLDMDAYRLERRGEMLAVEPKALDLLALLVSEPGHLFTKQEIFDRVWPGTAVTDHALTRVVAQLRRILGDDSREPRYIETVPTRGYRWLRPVTLARVAGAPSPSSVPRAPGPAEDPPRGEGGADKAAAAPGIPQGLARPGRWNAWALGLASVLLALFAAGFWTSHTESRATTGGAVEGPGPSAAWRDVAWPVQVTTHDGLDLHPALSPRGDALAFASDRSGSIEIYVRPLADAAVDRMLTSDGGHNLQPAWSPDGTQLAYHSTVKGGIWVVPAHGGVPRQIAVEGANPAWSPDGRLIAFQSDEYADVTPSAFGAQNGSTLWIVGANGTNLRPVTRAGNPIGGHAAPAWSPDGNHIAFTVADGGRNNGVWMVSLRTGDVAALVNRRGLYEVAFAPDGSALYAAGGEAIVHRLPLDAERGRLAGPIETIPIPGVPGVRGLSVSADGRRLAFAGLALSSQIWSQPIKADGSPAGPPRALTTDTSRRNSAAVVSPDGRRIAYMSTRRGEPPNVWVMDIDGTNRVQVTSNETSDGTPSWFPDSRRVAYFTNRNESDGLWSVDVTTRREEPLIDFSQSVRARLTGATPYEFELSPSMASAVVAVASPPEGRRALFVSPLATFTPERLTDPAYWIGYPAWSPDERQIAAELKDGSSTHLVVVDARTGEHRQITRERGQTWVRSWSPDGKNVAVAALRDGTWSLRWVEVATGRQGTITPPVPPHVYLRYPEWSPRNDVVVFERGELCGNIWTLPLH